MEHRKCRSRHQKARLMTDPGDREVLEIYKLHAEFADRVSQRREGANRLYVSLFTATSAVTMAFFGLDIGTMPDWKILFMIGGFGTLLSISWVFTLVAYRQLNSAKFRVLLELEKSLGFQFYESEWDPLREGKKSIRYWRLTTVENGAAALFGVAFLTLMIYSLLQ